MMLPTTVFLISMGMAAEAPQEPEDDCLGDAVCYGVAPLPARLEEHRTALRVGMALLPLGALWFPRRLLEAELRPPLRGMVRRSSLLHGLGPCLGTLGLFPTAGCTGPVGSLCGGVVGPLVLALVGGVAGFVVIPVGGTLLGACGGGVVGLVAGCLGGGLLGLILGPALLGCAACGPLTLWQVWIAPSSVLHAYRQGLELKEHQERTAKERTKTLAP